MPYWSALFTLHMNSKTLKNASRSLPRLKSTGMPWQPRRRGTRVLLSMRTICPSLWKPQCHWGPGDGALRSILPIFPGLLILWQTWFLLARSQLLNLQVVSSLDVIQWQFIGFSHLTENSPGGKSNKRTHSVVSEGWWPLWATTFQRPTSYTITSKSQISTYESESRGRHKTLN